MTTLIIADSRGRNLQQGLSEYADIGSTVVLSHSGADYESALSRSVNSIKTIKPARIIIMLGICSITNRDPVTKITQLKSIIVQEATASIMSTVKHTYKAIQSMHKCQISYATITGLDLTDYNNKRRKFMDEKQYNEYCTMSKKSHPQQTTLDQIVLELNRKLIAFNLEHKIPTTWTATAVHAYHNKKYHHYYNRLYDGCHPTQSTRNYWIKQLARVIKKMMKE